MLLRRAVAVGTATAIAVPLLSFSSNAFASSGPSVVIWTIDQPASVQKVVDNLISKFNKTYPGGGNVSIDWEGNGEAWKTKIAVAMAAHQPPTIFYTFGGALFDQSDPSRGRGQPKRCSWRRPSVEVGLHGTERLGFGIL